MLISSVRSCPGNTANQNLATLAVLAAALLFGTTGTVLVNAPDAPTR